MQKIHFYSVNTKDSSVQLYNIYWRRKDGLVHYTNPLDVYTLRNNILFTESQEMECFDTESGDSIMSVRLYIQGLFNINTPLSLHYTTRITVSIYCLL